MIPYYKDHKRVVILLIINSLLCDIIAYDHSYATSEIAPGYGFVAFLTGSVPYLQFDCLIIDLNVFLAEFDTNCVLGILIDFKFW